MSGLGQTGNMSQLPPPKGESSGAWGALVSACAAWTFDAMDLQIFTLILFPSVSELIGSENPGVVAYTGGIIVAWKLAALGIGGVAFGSVLGRTSWGEEILATRLVYFFFTARSGVAERMWRLGGFCG